MSRSRRIPRRRRRPRRSSRCRSSSRAPARATARTSADWPAPTQRCAELAAASGTAVAPGRQWRAYLSGTAPDGRPINARDRIGTGPWHNAKGAMIAATVPDLHGEIIRDRNQINKLNALTEKGTS
jgi:hypothetical protein